MTRRTTLGSCAALAAFQIHCAESHTVTEPAQRDATVTPVTGAPDAAALLLDSGALDASSDAAALLDAALDAALDAGQRDASLDATVSPRDAANPRDAEVDAAVATDAQTVNLPEPDWVDPFPATLSETGLFVPGTRQQLYPGVRPFQPKYMLWSDGATKRRWLYLPPGTQIDTSDMDAWMFPVGTRVWKEFSVNGVPVETRLLYKRGAGDWVMIAYAWRSDLSDADASPDGADNVAGTQHDIPAQDLCAHCHGNRPDAPLGPSAIQLSHALPGLTLTQLVSEGLLTNPPSGTFQIPGGPVAEQALGYLHANCGHCHNPRSGVYQEILSRTPHTGGPVFWEQTGALSSMEQTVGYLSTVGQPNSILPDLAIIEPGQPDQSEMVIRISQRGAGSLQMPPIATEVVDDAGVAAIRAWITSLPPR